MSGRYKSGCLYREKRKDRDVWVFRFRDGQINRKKQVGTVEQFPTKSAAMKACELLRININRGTRSPRIIAELVAHYRQKRAASRTQRGPLTTCTFGTGLCQSGDHAPFQTCGLLW
jgi:integrase